jgi:hypothetical protein
MNCSVAHPGNFTVKRFFLCLLIGLLPLCGCARHYVVRLNNGVRMATTSKPKLKNGAYHFKDTSGQETTVPAGRVVEIAPASMAKEENSTFKFSPK